MDHRNFDRLTRLFGATRSRRTALRALLGAALLGATARPAVATPCDGDNSKNNPRCTCGGSDCEPGKCFTHDTGCQLCCTEENDLIICGNKCCKIEGEDPCGRCQVPAPPSPTSGAPPCTTYVSGSYRRRR
jgi:hypothetical protein